MQILAESGGSTFLDYDQIDRVRTPRDVNAWNFSAFCVRPSLPLLAAYYAILSACNPAAVVQAPEEKARGITIATAHGALLIHATFRSQFQAHILHCVLGVWLAASTKLSVSSLVCALH